MTTAVTGTQGSSNTSTTQTTQSSSNSEISKDEFLKLLTYQLKSQDPMQPYNDQDFAAQLAQFSQLEQLTQMNTAISDQTNMFSMLASTISNSLLPGMLGKNAKASSDKVHIDGSNPVNIGYTLPYQVGACSITIKDSSGATVKTIDLSGSNLTSGDHTFSWDGTSNGGAALGAGDYSMSVSATNNNSSFSVDSYISGTIQAVRFKTDGTYLVVNGMELPLSSFVDIYN